MEFTVGTVPVPYGHLLPEVQSESGRRGRLTRSRERAIWKSQISALEEQVKSYIMLLNDSRTLERTQLETIKSLRAEVHQSRLANRRLERDNKNLRAGYNRLRVNSKGPSELSAKAAKWTPEKKAKHAEIQHKRLEQKALAPVTRRSRRRVRKEEEVHRQIAGHRGPGGVAVISHTPEKRTYWETEEVTESVPRPSEEQEALLKRAAKHEKVAIKNRARAQTSQKSEPAEEVTKIPASDKSSVLVSGDSSTSGTNWRYTEKVKNLTIDIDHMEACLEENRKSRTGKIWKCATGDCLSIPLPTMRIIIDEKKKQRQKAMELGAMHK